MPKYIGLDVHKNKCHATIMSEDGEIQKQEEFKNDTLGLGLFFDGIDNAQIAMEATYPWQPTYQWLEEKGYDVKLAHPKKTRIIGEAKIKTDCRDSEALAHLLRTNLLPESYVPPKEIRELRQKLYHRTYLVRERTKFKNKIRAELAKRGIELDSNPWTKKGSQQLGQLEIEEIDDYLAMVEALDERIKRISRELKQKSEENEEARLLMTIPGVGYFSALTILAEIGNINRFSNPEKLCSYAGIVPSTRQSGHTIKRGPITREGRRCLRWVLVESVWSHLTHTNGTRLTGFFKKVASRRERKVAVVATARKLLSVIY